MTEGIKTLRQQLQKLFIAFYFKTQLVIHYIIIYSHTTKTCITETDCHFSASLFLQNINTAVPTLKL